MEWVTEPNLRSTVRRLSRSAKLITLSMCMLAVTALADDRAALPFMESIEIAAPDAAELSGAVVVSNFPSDVLEQLKKLPEKSPDWRSLLAVRVATADGDSAPSLLGHYKFQNGAVQFTPRFPWRPGVSYVATFHIAGRTAAQRTFEIRRRKTAARSRVTAVYPSASLLPANVLKFYIHFSEPMSRGGSYQHIALLKTSGEIVDDPFLEIGEELWDRDGKRLTLLIDPGRIKRGLKPRMEIGPVFEAEQDYTLLVRSTWRDDTGNPLASSYMKKFRVSPPDHAQPAMSSWTVTAPKAGSADPLLIRFSEPLDHAILQSAITVRFDGVHISGRVTVSDAELAWSFRPSRPWAAGDYELMASPNLEDRAGNSLGRLFEQSENCQVLIQPKPFRRVFEISQ